MTLDQKQQLENLFEQIFEGDFCMNHAESYATIAFLAKYYCYKENIINCQIPNDESLAIHLEVDVEGVIIQ